MSDELQDRLDTLENEYEALTQDIDTLKSERDEAEARAEAAEQQAARLRAALSWYADESNHSQERRHVFESSDPERHPPIIWDATSVAFDAGAIARAALAGSQPAPAAETNDGLCPRCGCCSGFDKPDGSVVCIGRCDVPERHAELARGGQAEGDG